MEHNHGSPSSSRLKEKETEIETVVVTLLDCDEGKSEPKQPEPVTVVDDIPVEEEPKPHVLIVDDDPHTKVKLELDFVLNDCKVTTAGSCEEALRLLRIDHDGVINSDKQETIPPVDLVVVDYFMVGVPGMTGYMMLPILKNSPMKDISVMMLAPPLEPNRSEQYYKCRQDGVDFFAPKPLTHSVVQILKQAILQKKKYGKGDEKSTSEMSSYPTKANYITACVIASDPDAFDNHFHGDEDMQQMQNQFYDQNQLEDQYTYFEDYLSPFLADDTPHPQAETPPNDDHQQRQQD